ncbi:MAG: hypothetical protein J6U49_01075 [Alistipes sp.]|nr:hypothetical protein [Alistipes sp.]
MANTTKSMAQKVVLAQYYDIADENTKATMRVDVWERPDRQTTKKEVDDKLAEYGPQAHAVYENGVWRVFRFAEVSEADIAAIQTLLLQVKLNKITTSVNSIYGWVKFWSILAILAGIASVVSLMFIV